MRIRPFALLLMLLLAACSQVSPEPNPTLAPTATSFSYQRQFGSFGSGDGQFNAPYGTGFDALGNVYVLEAGNNRVQVFDDEGNFIRKFASEGSGDGQFNAPVGLTLDALGNIYVADTFNNRVQVFANDGTFIRKFGSEGTSDEQFRSPFGIALDTLGSIYVADTGNGRVLVFTKDGTFIRKFGSFGSDDGQLDNPRQIAFDAQGNVYVTDASNDRVQVFDDEGNFIRKFGSEGSGDGQFRFPNGIALDASGNIYVADTENSRVQVFDDEGTFITKFGVPGVGDGQFNFPSTITLDALSNVYVTDTFNHRVQVFTQDPLPDTTKPSITLTTPANGATYPQGGSVTVFYSCADEQGGSGLKSCTGTTPNGSALDTSTPGTYSFTVNAEDNAGNTNSVTHTYTVQAPPPPVAQPYTVDFEKTVPNKLVYSVKLGSGVTYQGQGSPSNATVPVVGKRASNGRILEAHVARVVSIYGSKRLIAGSSNTSNTPNATGGRIKLTFTNFDSAGARLTSITLSNLTKKGAYLTFYYVNGTSSRQNVGTTAAGGSLVVPLDVKNLRAVDVYAPNAYAVDNVKFEVTPKS